jgi:hypothetical protein
MPTDIDLSPLRSAAVFVGRRAADVDKVVQRARVTLARRLVVEARRDIQTEYALPATRIRAGLTVRNEGETVVLTGSKKGVGLINYPNTGGRRGKPFLVQIRRDEGRTLWDDGTFVGTALGGSKQAFVRDTRAKPQRMTRGVNKGRLKQPLLRQFGPSVAQMLGRPERRERLAEFGGRILGSEIDRQFR